MDINITTLSKNKNVILNIALILAAFIVAFNIYGKKAVELRSLKEKKEMELKKNKVVEDISQLEGKLNKYKELFSKKDPTVIMNNISDIAGSAGIKINSIKPIGEKKEGSYIEIPFELIINARSFHVLGEFISKIESHNDLFTVEMANIAPDVEKNELIVNLVIYSKAVTD